MALVFSLFSLFLVLLLSWYYRATSNAGFCGLAFPILSLMYTFGSINNFSLFSFFPRFCLCFFSSFLFSRRESSLSFSLRQTRWLFTRRRRRVCRFVSGRGGRGGRRHRRRGWRDGASISSILVVPVPVVVWFWISLLFWTDFFFAVLVRLLHPASATIRGGGGSIFRGRR